MQPTWVERSVALRLAQPASLYSPDPSQIFSGVVVCCARMTPHDTEMVASAVTALGGGHKHRLCDEVTHLVATTRESTKMQALAEHRHVPVVAVAPHWINDSFSLNRLLPLDDYQFDLDAPDTLPVCLRATRDVPPRGVPSEPPSLPSQARGDGAVLAGKTVLFARDVHNGSFESHPQLHALRDRIERAGGACAPPLASDAAASALAAAVAAADVIVARHRETDEFRHAVHQAKTIGTLAWLIHVLSTGHLSAPRDRLLHFPYPQTAVEGFPAHTITITNYTGQARAYLKELIARMGGTFTPELTPANTVCVALELHGDKVAKAREWNVAVVNHVWLESCFASWTNENLAQQRFITFPGAAQLSAVLGKVGITDEQLAPWADEAAGEAAVEAATAERVPGLGSPNEWALPADQALSELEARAALVDESVDWPSTGEAEVEPAGAAEGTGAAAEAPAESPAEAEAPAEPPVEAEAPAEAETPAEPPVEAEAPAVAEAPAEPPAKRARTKPGAPRKAPRTPPRRASAPVVATTSVELSGADAAALDALHVRRTDDIHEATHLVAKNLTRTEKMLCAIARGLEIVAPSWIRDMARHKRVIDAAPHALVDRAKEAQWGIELAAVLARSRAAPGALLKGHHFYLTKSVQPARDVLRRVIAAAGGASTAVSTSLPARTVLDDPEHHHVVSCRADAKALSALQTQCAKTGGTLVAYTPELVLASVLRQELALEPAHRL